MSGGPERQDLLLEALLNTHDLRHRYHHQAYFRHAVQLLVRALPKHLEFLAQSADEAERDWVAEEYLTWNPGPVPGGPGREER